MTIFYLALAIISGLIYWLFGTEIGMSVRATGNNQKMARAQGIDTDFMIILGLMLSNGLIALSGALFAQDASNAMTESGRGAIVIGLAAIILGEIIFGRKRSFKVSLISSIIGAIIFFIIKQFAIYRPISNIESDEFILIHAHENELESIKEDLDIYFQMMENYWKDFLPMQYQKVINRKELIIDDYYCVVVNDGADDIIRKVKQLLEA